MLASSSAVKTEGVASAFGLKPDAVHHVPTTTALAAPEQPLDEQTESLAQQRLDYALEVLRVSSAALGGMSQGEDRVIAVESGIYGLGTAHVRDVAVAKVAGPDGRVFTGYGTIAINPLAKLGSSGVQVGTLLSQVTPDVALGQLIHEADPSIPADNWMASVAGVDRREQVAQALASAERKRRLYSSMGLYKDFPKPPVLFQDIGDIFADPELLNDLVDLMAEEVTAKFPGVNKLLMLESRGFHLAGALQQALRARGHVAGIVQARKPNKLPGALLTATYGKEYGKDSLSVQVSKFVDGDVVLVVDDIIATGGTLRASEDLLQAINDASPGTVKLGGTLVVNQVDPLVSGWVVKSKPAVLLT